MIKFSELSECLACSGTSLEQVLDLGAQPLANNFTSNPMPAEYFPLALNFCHACSHLHLTHSVNRENLYSTPHKPFKNNYILFYIINIYNSSIYCNYV